MLAKITLYDGTVYKIATATTDTQDGIYLGRIKDELQLVSQMQEAGNAPTTVNLTIINHDNFIPRTKDLWAAELLLTNDNNVSWRGKINFCNFDADGNLYVTASEKTAPELELQLPDEVRQVYTVDEDFHQSSVTMTIPLVVGGSTSNPITLSTILIDKTRGIYLICVGEIRSIVKVYNGTEELPNTAYTAYTGTSSQAEHAGFAYVKINEDYRLNADGSYAEINVEVVGLKLANFTEEECRNGALFLYYFLTTAATGVNGWGCGIDPSEIDTASFQSAITLCNQLGYKLDGIMWLRQSAQSWIDQICQAIHGKYSINANGKRSLFIDYAGNASKKTFTASNMQVDKYGKNSYTSVVYNKGILSYDYNPITGLFMQSAQYENAESIAQIGEQKFVGESYMLKDPTTALAVLEYTCKRSQTAAEAIEFKTDDINTLLRAGDVITINRPDLSINNALYQIQNISITDYEASISAVKFDTSVFSVTSTASTVNWGSEKAITPALTPAQATNLLLSTGFDINPDGTGTPYISGTFTVPDGGWLAAAVQYGIGAEPTNWTELALITDGRFKISPVNVGTVYSVRVRMITATGHSSYITGQITATGDTTPPAEPTIAVHATDKTVTVQCGLDNPPYDMGGFQIYRKKSTEADSSYTLIAMVAANRGYASYSDYVSEYITYNYKAKSYDRSGNLSTNFSNVASVTVTGIQANDISATALKLPTGSILRLSAKNCTTASIAEANGVKDVSGRGNHGQAGSGVSVVADEKEGDCYSFDRSSNTASKITFGQNLKTTFGDGLTFWVKFKTTQSDILQILFDSYTSAIRATLTVYEDNLLGFSGGGVYDHKTSFVTTSDVWYSVALVFSSGKIDCYIDSVLIDSINVSIDQTLTANVYVGNRFASNNLGLKGLLKDFRIYPRVLSASEIKTIYMFPDDVTFGQLTADLIGANIIKASNLVLTENIITTNAQIKQAVIDNMTITGNANFIAEQQARAQVQTNLNTVTNNIYSSNTTTINGGKITTGTIQAAAIAANAITTEKLAVTAISRPIGCKWELNLKGVPSKTFAQDDILPDGTGFSTKILVKGTTVQVATDTTYNQVLKFGASGYLRVNGSWFNAQMTFDCIYGAATPTDENKAIVDGRNSSFYGFGIYHVANTGKIQAVGNYNAVVESPAAFPSGYHRLTVVWNNSATYKTKIYLDGVLWIQSTTQTASNTGGALSYCLLGSNSTRSGNINSNAWIKSAAFWKRALSDSEVKTLFMMGIDNESGQITADRIAAGCVETRHLTADAIVGKTFQTASNTGTSNAAGVRFNSSGIQGFNGSAKKFDLNTNGKLTCSDVDLTGKITATSGSFGDCKINTNDANSHYCSMYLASDSTKNASLSINSSSDFIQWLKGTQRGVYIEANPSGVGESLLVLNKSNASRGGRACRIDSSGSDALIVKYSGTDTAASALYVTGKAYCSAGVWSGCDENLKKDIKDVSTLDKLKSIRVKKFKYSEKKVFLKDWVKDKKNEIKYNVSLLDRKTMPEPPEDNENSPEFIMAMAGEFNKAFGVDNGNEESINYTNAIGVCMRAIQELAEISDAQKAEIAELKAKLKIQQDEKLDVEQEASYTEKSDNSKDTDNLDFPDVGKNGENQQEEQKTDEK